MKKITIRMTVEKINDILDSLISNDVCYLEYKNNNEYVKGKGYYLNHNDEFDYFKTKIEVVECLNKFIESLKIK